MGWSFSLMPVRYYNSPGGGYLSDLLDGVRWAAQHGAQCINVSQTGVEYSSVQTTGAYVRGLGSLLFWAAGNDARDLSWFDWDDVIVVGATDRIDHRASFSAYGLAVDVFAPGTDIYSTGMPSGLAIGSGTSAATPIAAGIAALAWIRSPSLTPDEVEARLFAGCIDLGPPGNDVEWGWGRVDAPRTLGAAAFAPYCGTGANAATDGYVLYTAPVLGKAVLATVTPCATGASAAFLVGYASPLTFWSPWGEVLVNVDDPAGELLGMPVATGNPATFLLPVPGDPSFAGFAFYTQAASIGGAHCLHCAYACTVGY